MVAFSNKVIDKELLSPPGDTILETMEAIGMSREHFANAMGQTVEWVDQLIDGTIEITNYTALQLQYVLSIPENFWIAREKDYRDILAQLAAQS